MRGRLTLEVEYDPEVTDIEAVAVALDLALEQGLSTPLLLSEHGNPGVKEFFVEAEDVTVAPSLEPYDNPAKFWEVKCRHAFKLEAVSANHVRIHVDRKAPEEGGKA
jgi:hypothetical protein